MYTYKTNLVPDFHGDGSHISLFNIMFTVNLEQILFIMF